MIRFFTTLSVVALIAGCATAPRPFAADHPASPDAPEGARLPRQTSLRTDDATRRSRALLSAAQKDQEKWDAYGPVSGTPEDAPKTGDKPQTKHDHH